MRVIAQRAMPHNFGWGKVMCDSVSLMVLSTLSLSSAGAAKIDDDQNGLVVGSHIAAFFFLGCHTISSGIIIQSVLGLKGLNTSSCLSVCLSLSLVGVSKEEAACPSRPQRGYISVLFIMAWLKKCLSLNRLNFS